MSQGLGFRCLGLLGCLSRVSSLFAFFAYRLSGFSGT